MARRYGTVSRLFWSDPKMRGLSLEARHLALWYLTCDQGNAAGIFWVPVDIAALSAGLTVETGTAADKELQNVNWIRRCPTTDWVWIRNFLKHNQPANQNVWVNISSTINDLPGEFSYIAEMAQHFEPYRNCLNTPTLTQHRPFPMIEQEWGGSMEK